MRCFDGRRTPDEIALSLAEQGMRIPARTVDAFARKLSAIGVLERTLAERTTLELERMRAERQRRRQPTLFRGELLRMRWSMGDPDEAFDRVLPAIRWCFTPAFIVVSAFLFVAYFGILAARWDEFAHTSWACTRSRTSRPAPWSSCGSPRWSSSSSTSSATGSRASTSAAKCTRWASCSSISSPPSTAT